MKKFLMTAPIFSRSYEVSITESEHSINATMEMHKCYGSTRDRRLAQCTGGCRKVCMMSRN
jgi:hypothetical protein